jgi:hypothetical protein
MPQDSTNDDPARRALLAEHEWLHLALLRLERVAWEQAREAHNPQQFAGLRAVIHFKEALARYLADARRSLELDLPPVAMEALARERDGVERALEVAANAVVDARLFSELAMLRAHLPGFFDRETAVLQQARRASA